MKKIFPVFLIFAMVINFTSCKKGDNDPTLPFGTRDGLITNTWTLQSLTKTVTSVNALGSTDTRTYIFDGSTMTEKHTNIWGAISEDSYAYSDSLVISKDNTYYRAIEEGDSKTETKAFWYWHNSNKNKIGISFKNGTIYFINRLARKELVLEYSDYVVNTDGDGNVVTVTNNEMLTYSAE